MTYLSDGIQQRLQQAFISSDIALNVKSDHIILENSQNQTEEKIRQVIELAGFHPLISENKIDNNFVFTIEPYKIPASFVKLHLSQVSNHLKASLALQNTEEQSTFGWISTSGEAESLAASSNEPCSSSSLCEVNQTPEKANYFNFDEVSLLLKSAAFVDEKKDAVGKDKWSGVNNFRSFVSPALNKGLSEIISQHTKGEYPIVEIGSGIGYSLPNSISTRTIRIQPSNSECQLLRKSIADPIYRMDIDRLYNSLLESGKKIPLFFALDVFDTMSTNARKTSFSQISQLQNAGDRILIMLDTNPCLDAVIGQIEALYPEHVALPYLPLSYECAKHSVIVVPSKLVEHKPAISQLPAIINREATETMSGRIPQMQYMLHQLQNKLNLTVIDLEDFYAELVKSELEQTGYTVNVNYHTSFTVGDLPEGISGIKQDLIYKPVTDIATVRQWSLDDKKLISYLAKKGLKLPDHFNETFLNDIRKKGQKIFGAEILVIEATKT